MDINSFNPSGKKWFEVTSGKLLIADPFNLGYPEDTESKIEQVLRATGVKKPFVAFPLGVIYYTLTADGQWGTDCVVGVYRKEKTIQLIRNDNIANADELEEEVSIDEDIEERLVDAKTYRRLRRPIFDVPVDRCCLLIGDAEKYILPETEWKFADNHYVPPEDKINHENNRRKVTRNIYDTQVLPVQNGIYTAQHILKEETLILRKIK